MFWQLGVRALVWAIVAAGPSGDLSERQLDYAKQLFGEGSDALGEKDYETALEKFEEAYKYAPDKHVFNFNIAEAALAGGKCSKARSHYLRFLELVAEHPERRNAKRKLKVIEKKKCAGPDDEKPELTKRSQDPPDVAAEKETLFAALDATRRAETLHELVMENHGALSPFKAMVRAKRRHRKKLERVIQKRGYEAPEPAWTRSDIPVAGTFKQACRQGVEHEDKHLETYQAAREAVMDERSMKRILRMRNTIKRWHRPKLVRCMKR